MRRAMATLGREEVEDIMREQGKLEVGGPGAESSLILRALHHQTSTAVSQELGWLGWVGLGRSWAGGLGPACGPALEPGGAGLPVGPAA